MLENGTLIYPRRGKFPNVPEGYERDKGDPYILIPKYLSCVHRAEESTHKGSCGCKKITVICKLFNSVTNQKICKECKNREPVKEETQPE